MLIQAVTFVVSAVALLAIRTDEVARPAPNQPRLRHEIIEGLQIVCRTRLLRATAITSAAGNFAFAVASAVTIIFMSRSLGLSAAAIGLVIAVGAIAAMAGAAITPALSRAFGSARIIWLSLAVTGPIALLGPLAQAGWLTVLIVIGIAAGELGQIVYAISNVSLRQRLCPERMLGRVNATMRFVVMGLFPLGAVLGGVLGELVGLRPTLWLAGVIIALSPLAVYRALRGTTDVDELPMWHRGSDGSDG